MGVADPVPPVRYAEQDEEAPVTSPAAVAKTKLPTAAFAMEIICSFVVSNAETDAKPVP